MAARNKRTSPLLYCHVERCQDYSAKAGFSDARFDGVLHTTSDALLVSSVDAPSSDLAKLLFQVSPFCLAMDAGRLVTMSVLGQAIIYGKKRGRA